MSDRTGKKFGIWKILGAVVALLVIAVVALPFIINVNQFRPQIESKLAAVLGREVKLGNLKLSLLSGSVIINDIAIADNPAFSRSLFVTAKSLQAGIELKPLIFSKEIRITGISLDSPAIALIYTPSGKWNFSDLGSHAGSGPGNESSGKASADLPGKGILIKQLKLTNGRIQITDAGKKPSIYDNVSLEVRNLSFTASFPFTLTATLPGDGKLKLEGNAGPLNQKDAMATPLNANLAVTHLDLVGSGFVPRDSGLTGVVDFSGAVTSDGRQAKSKGQATIEKLRVVKGGSPASKPTSLEYFVNYDMANRKGTLENANILFGKASARMNGNYEMRGNDLVMKMRLHGTNMPVQDLTALLPAFGVTLPKGASLQGGVLNADLTAEGSVEKMVISGTANVLGTRLVGFDLAGKIGKMAVIASLAGIKPNQETEIEKFASSVKMTPESIQVSDLLLVMPALGRLSGAGSIAPDQSLNFTMQALLKPSGDLATGLARLAKGDELNVPFFIRGAASDPKFVPDMKNAARSLLGSALSEKGADNGQAKTGDILGNALRDLLKKKK
jgi:AsmA protein